MEFESFHSGVLLKIGIQEGQTASVDSMLAIIGPAGTDVSGIDANAAATAPAKSEAAPVAETKNVLLHRHDVDDHVANLPAMRPFTPHLKALRAQALEKAHQELGATFPRGDDVHVQRRAHLVGSRIRQQQLDGRSAEKCDLLTELGPELVGDQFKKRERRAAHGRSSF